MRVRLTAEPDGAVALESPYDPVLVDGLKREIPYGGRQWDPTRKRWIVSALYVDVLLAFLKAWGAQIQDDRAPTPADTGALVAPPPMPAALRQAFDVLFLAYTAPLCVAEGSFRALAKFYHPDKGGTSQDFHAVNDAIAVIRGYLDPREETPDDDIPF